MYFNYKKHRFYHKNIGFKHAKLYFVNYRTNNNDKNSILFYVAASGHTQGQKATATCYVGENVGLVFNNGKTNAFIKLLV